MEDGLDDSFLLSHPLLQANEKLERLLLMAAASCQGGHSYVGSEIARHFDIPFPLRMEALELAAHKRGYTSFDLWPWLVEQRKRQHSSKSEDVW
jgi:hypothetical protein